MRTLNELLDLTDPAIALIQQWASEAEIPVEILPPSAMRSEVLVELQVTTRSVLGALAHDTGGVLVDDGWLRMLGSGHPKLTRDIVSWNAGRSNGFCLVADDAIGGFFAINGGALGDDLGATYYHAPDTLEWEGLDVGHSDFTEWAFTKGLRQFYAQMRWQGWEKEVCHLPGDQCFNFFPFLFTEEGSTQTSSRRAVPIDEQYSQSVG